MEIDDILNEILASAPKLPSSVPGDSTVRVIGNGFASINAIDPDEVEVVEETVREVPGKENKATHEKFMIGQKSIGSKQQFLYRRNGDKPRVVSGPVWVIGEARNADSGQWHFVIKFINKDDRVVQWLMPASLLGGDKRDILKQLYVRGLFIVNEAELLLYVRQAASHRFILVDNTGWHGDHFVLPTGMASTANHNYLLTSDTPANVPVGTLDSWKTEVAARCIGNSMLILGLSVALASSLLSLSGGESGGIHLVGPSSTGKTTVANAAASVWNMGIQSWDITPTKLEITSMRHSDIGLVLDEIGQANAYKIGDFAYMLGGGRGKGRSNQKLEDCKSNTWRILVLSTGEVSVGERIASTNGRVTAGQEVRIIDVQVDAGKGMGAFELLHDCLDAAALSDALNNAVKENTGHAGPAFVEYVVAHRSECEKFIRDVWNRMKSELCLSYASGQVQRVAKRFALLAATGEIATKAGITGWSVDTAYDSAIAVFNSWRKSWTPTGSRESQTAIELIRAFIQCNEARFEDQYNPRKIHTPRDRAGYRDMTGGEYWMFVGVFKNICAEAGISENSVKKALDEAGDLVTSMDGGKKRYTTKRTADVKQQRFIVLKDSILCDNEHYGNDELPARKLAGNTKPAPIVRFRVCPKTNEPILEQIFPEVTV